MATPPRYRKLTIEVPETLDEADPFGWFSRALPQLQSFMDDTVNALDKKLTRAQNFASQRYVLEFTTGAAPVDSFPFKFNCTLSVAPECIEIAQARAVTAGGSFSGARDVSNWESLAGGVIQINEITGLRANTKYLFVLLVT